MLCIIGFFEYFGFCCRLVCIDELLDLWVVVYLGGLGWVNKFLVVSGDIYMWFVFDGFVVVVSGEQVLFDEICNFELLMFYVDILVFGLFVDLFIYNCWYCDLYGSIVI